MDPGLRRDDANRISIGLGGGGYFSSMIHTPLQFSGGGLSV